jgi:hypothetical protein
MSQNELMLSRKIIISQVGIENIQKKTLLNENYKY